ncbi:uncharacterized protein LOC124194801 [Daphnia pulex]|uniref:uncharacterized protein LOC124194801 n=1 Tax=Daphnia pulex TaxID=6669 RepID=UPI001EDF4B00|nr:uncharacterized protein LOC124194801 [Daphnia pulex]
MGAKSFSVKVPHTCPANLDVERDASLITKAKVNACSNPLASSRKVVEKEMLQIFQQNPDRNLPVVANVVRAVQRKKQSSYPKNPTDLHFEWGPFERCIPDGYFRADVVIDTPRRYARHLIFATDQQLHLLRKAKRWYGDGTFFICPTPFYQVFGIHAFIRHVTVLMSGKRKKDYVAVFSSILELLTLLGEPRVEEFMMDFEAAMWQACRAVFPTVKPVGCSFHLTQSFYRNIKAIGLSPAYRKDSQTRNTCRELLSLYLLPAEKIRKRFQSIASNATGLMLRFCNYVETTYINSTIWPPECWSMFMQHVRTNNNVESTHNNLKAVAGKLSI